MTGRMSRADTLTVLTENVHDKYGRWVSWEVVYAEALIWIETAWAEFLDNGTDTSILRSGTNHLAAFCERLKANVVGYQIEDVAWYSLRELKDLVEQVMAGAPSERMDVAVADVQHGLYHLLDAVHRGSIFLFHAGYMHEAGYLDALRELQTVLGGAKPKGLLK